MKGKITIDRATLRAVLERHLAESLVAPHRLVEFTVHKNGAIEMSVTTTPAPALPLAAEGTREPDHEGGLDQ